MEAEAQLLCLRLARDHDIHLDPDLINNSVKELELEHEVRLVLEYGYNALVRYYSPTDSRLPENAIREQDVD